MQKSVIVNTMLCSKVWYLAHTYPMSGWFYKQFKKIVFEYIWNRGYQPIKQETLCLPKEEGGIGLLDIWRKSQIMLVSSFLKVYLNESVSFIFSYYYMHMCVDPIIPKSKVNCPVSYIGTPYYREIISLLRILVHHKKFPVITNIVMYKELKLKKYVVSAVEKYPCLNWKCIWKNINVKFISPFSRNVIYRFVHDALPSKRKLFQMGITSTDICQICGLEENIIHTVYFCQKNKDIVNWLKRLLRKICAITQVELLKILYFDFPAISNKTRILPF